MSETSKTICVAYDATAEQVQAALLDGSTIRDEFRREQRALLGFVAFVECADEESAIVQSQAFKAAGMGNGKTFTFEDATKWARDWLGAKPLAVF